MNLRIKAISMAAVFCCLGFAVPSFAGQHLDALNAAVEQQAAQMEQQSGVLLDTQERIELKLALIAKKAVGDAVSHHKTLAQAAQTAFEIFEIADPYEQRQLLVKIQSMMSMLEGTGNGGTTPDYP